MCLILDFLEILELGDWVFSFGILEFLDFVEFSEILECLEFLESGDSGFSLGCFAIVRCCCILWNLCWLKRI